MQRYGGCPGRRPVERLPLFFVLVFALLVVAALLVLGAAYTGTEAVEASRRAGR
jgi:hypothetical protein